MSLLATLPADSPWRRTSVVAVTHHSAGVIGDCLGPLLDAAEIIIVDNASADDTREIVRRTVPGVRLTHNRTGLGFGNGANIGLGQVTGEFALLKVLLAHPRVPLSRDKLMELARGREYEVFDRAIDVQISRLRKLVEPDPAHPAHIQTVWGFGYVFVPDGKA